MELQNDAEWVIWCKAKPKDKATQTFREYGKCIFEGKRAKVTQDNDNQEGSLGGKHVTRARGWWKRGNVDACAAQTNMQCWVSQEMIFDDEQVETHLSEAWEHESGKDEMNVVLQGLGGWDAMTSQVKPGREMDRSTSVQWVQEASAFRDLGVVSQLGWAEKRRGSAR